MSPGTRERRPSPGAPSTGIASHQAAQSEHQSSVRRALQPMPELTAEQYDALKDDIGLRGVIVPVVHDQHGRVVDGHNRTAIADELGIDCPVETITVTDDEAADLAVTLNCARRHLSREQTRHVIAGEIARRPDDSDRAIARRVGCSPSTVGAVRTPMSNLDTLDGALAAAEVRRLHDEIIDNLEPVFGVIIQEIYRARSNKISAAEIVGALTIAMHETEVAGPEYKASFIRGAIYGPILNYVLADVSDAPYRPHWDHETFLPLTDEDRQWQLDCITFAVAMRAEVAR